MPLLKSGKMKGAVETLIVTMEEEIQFKQEELEKAAKLMALQQEQRKKELNQLRQQLHLLEQKWR